MKYFKIVNKASGDEQYISSDLPSASISIRHIREHLSSHEEYDIEEISYDEFNSELEKVFTEGA